MGQPVRRPMRQQVKGQMAIIGKIVFILFALGIMLWLIYKWSSNADVGVENLQKCDGGTYRVLLGATQGVCSASKDCVGKELPTIKNSYWFSVASGCPSAQFCCLAVPSNGDGSDVHSGCTARDNADGIWNGLCAQTSCTTDFVSKGQGTCSSGEVCCTTKDAKVTRTLQACYAYVNSQLTQPGGTFKDGTSTLKVDGYCSQKGCADESFPTNKIYLLFSGGAISNGKSACTDGCCAAWACNAKPTQLDASTNTWVEIPNAQLANGFCSNNNCKHAAPVGQKWEKYGTGTCGSGYNCCVLQAE